VTPSLPTAHGLDVFQNSSAYESSVVNVETVRDVDPAFK
jgi:hypothetical protein